MKVVLAALASLSLAGCVTTQQEALASAPRGQKAIIVERARHYNIPQNVIEYVAKKESGFRCQTGGRYKGPLQISPGSARALGYNGSPGGLDNCSAGLEYGLRHLALCVRKVGNNARRAAHCHAVPGAYGVRLVWLGSGNNNS